jgi:transaldolase / glucose-6-phosphate isomerase
MAGGDRRVEAPGGAIVSILETDRHVTAISHEVDGALHDLREMGAVNRLWHRDHTLWQESPVEVADRLGWLDLPTSAALQVRDLEAVAAGAHEDGLTHALVLGMGGSSLFPLVLADVYDDSGTALELTVLDSVDPTAVTRVLGALPIERTLVIASSKSGTTAETRTLLEAFWDESHSGGHFVAVTDPGTSLAVLARERGFRAVLEAPEDVGGRFSALTAFGLMPATARGADVNAMIGAAQTMAEACRGTDPDDLNPAARLAATIVGAARAGRDKLTLVLPARFAAFGSWIEQLVAESTGKDGLGIIPVVGEPVGPADVYGADRLFISYGDHDGLHVLAGEGHPVIWLDMNEPADLGAEVFRWEAATALVGALLGINPFDQPDVEAAKQAARRALDAGGGEVEPEPAGPLLDSAKPGDYIALLAYADPESPVVEELEDLRIDLRDRTQLAVTLGIGPRYLHSTGQLHKGGPDTGVFLQVVVPDDVDLEIPGQDFTFGALKAAQAAGDLDTLKECGRRAARVELDDLLGLA